MARFEQEARETAYRVYVTDSIFYQAQEKRLTTRFADVFLPKEETAEQTGEEIVADVIRRAGLVVADGSF